MKNKKYLIGAFVIGAIFFSTVAAATVTLPQNPKKGTVLVGKTTSSYGVLATSTNGLCLTASSSATLGVAWAACSSGGSTFTTTTLSAAGTTLSQTAYIFATSSDTNIGITIGASGSTMTWTPTWIGTLADARISSAATWNAKLSTPFTGNVSAGGFNLTGIGNLTATSATIGTLNISSLAQSPLVIGGSATTTIYGDGSTSTFGGRISATGYSPTNWDTAFTDRLKWDGGATGLVAATGRTSLGLTDTATLASSTWLKVANNLSDGTAATMRTNLGLTDTATIASSTFLTKATDVLSNGFNVLNATTSATATTTIQKQYFAAMTISQVSCSTNGASVTISMDERASSTPQTLGTDVFGNLVCDSDGATTSTFTNATIANLAVLNTNIMVVANSTTTLRVYIKYTND